MHGNGLWRRIASITAVSALAIAALAGCAQPGKTDNVVLRVGDPFADVWGDALTQAAKSYEKSHPAVKIELESVPFTGYSDVYQTQLVGGSAADILFLDPPAVASFAGKGFLLPLGKDLSSSTEWGKTFVGGALDATRSADGGQYLVPWSSTAVLVAYRKSLYKDAGIDAAPANFDDWVADMKRLYKKEGVSPLNVSLRGDDASMWWLLTNKLNATLRPLTSKINLIHKKGWKFDAQDVSSTAGEAYTTDELYVAFKKGLIDPVKSPGYRAAVEQVVKLIPFLNNDTATAQPGQVNGKFGAGQLPQIVSVGQAIASTAARADDAHDFGTFDLPTITKSDFSGLTAGGENPLAGPRNGFAVNASSKVKKQAIEFLKYLTSSKTVSAMYAVHPQGDPSSVQGVNYPKGSVLPDGGGQKFAEIDAYGFGLPPTFDSQDFDEFNAQWQKLLTGNSTVDEFLAERSASNLAALKRNLVLNADSIDQGFIDKQLGKKAN